MQNIRIYTIQSIYKYKRNEIHRGKTNFIDSLKLRHQGKDTVIQRSTLLKCLKMHSIESFRELNIQEYDLNISQKIEQLEQIDEEVTPLVYCAYFGLKQILRLFLTNSQIDIDQQTPNNKQTPLITACTRGNYEIVHLLLLHKAEPNKPNALGHGPLTAVIFRLLENTITFQNTTICFKIGELLIQNGANVNWIIDKHHGYSLLHYFCKNKSSANKNICRAVIKFLLKHGANPDQLTLEDKNCWHLASQEVKAIIKQNLVK